MRSQLKIKNKKFLIKNKQSIIPPDLKYKYFENCMNHPFKPNTKKFNLVNAWWLAEFSFLSYAPQDFINSQINRAGFKSFRFFDSSKCKCFVANTIDFAIVAFRGTSLNSPDFFIDLINDLNIKLIDFKEGGKVHCGFYNAFKDIWNKNNGLKDYLLYLKKNNPCIKYWFTGHSLGAAIASIAAASFKYCHTLYTFGAPKVGNLAYVNSLKFKTFRIVNYNDLITFLPPSFNKKIEVEYVHHGKIKYIDKNLTLNDEVKFSENQLTKSITISSKIFDIVFDKNKNIILKLLNLKDKEIDKEVNSSSVTLVSRLLNKLKSLILRNKEISITNHAPIYYVVHLWNIYIKS
jgi:triacylglycerol lipase